MSLQYFSITFDMGDHDNEIWLALLGEWSFESFHEEESKITGYIQDHDITENLMQFIGEQKGIHFEDYELALVADKNWNEVWESSFNPVAVDDYCYIRATFHPIEKHFKHVITISPKMAFGTGHHATTFMMLQAMSEIDFKGKRVFDFGCGTGILGIVAAREGAAEVIGVDIQTEAIENSDEHAEMNEVGERCKFYLGGIEKAGNDPFDVILANINRNVILQYMLELSSLLKVDGFLLISGIMFDDVEIIKNVLGKLNFEVIELKEKDQWVQMTVRSKA